MCPADSAQSRLPRLARTHDFSVAKATRGYLNEAAKSNAPRPSHPTDSPTCVNSMSSCKTPECPSPSSAGTSSANVGDHVLNISELEATSRCEVLCSDINEMNSIDPILLHFYRFEPFETNFRVLPHCWCTPQIGIQHCRSCPSGISRNPSMAPSHASKRVYTIRVNAKFVSKP